MSVTRSILLGISILFAGSSPSAEETLIASGAIWRYYVSGQPAGAWTSIGFDHSQWDSGPSELGYGDGDEATVIPFGPGPSPDPADKYLAYYFRRAFAVADPSQVQNLRLRILRDDGAIVYLNGNEVQRTNMASGAVTETTLAQGRVNSFEETHFFSFDVDPALLVTGTNVLAVEVHQWDSPNSDVSFDLELASNVAPAVIRGPYLQRGAPDSIVLRWRTDVATDSRVWLGDAPGNLTWMVDDPASTQEHEVEVTGLVPETTFFYAVGETGSSPLVGDDADHWFETPPPVGVARPMSIWVLGDSGTANINALRVRDAFLGLPESQDTDFVLLLGDNAYTDGTDGEYEFALFEFYADFLPSRVFWPTRGNHEAVADTYYSVFTAPTAGEAGGLPSGTEAYYSFDYANVHFISLDSQESDRSVGGAMWTWLRSDLSSTAQDWIIAFWHHPPYSKGSHDSDVELNLVEMRENFLPLLEASGVDLVLGGHSHSYERSFLIDGHYLDSSTWHPPTMAVDGGSGNPNTDGAYVKDAWPGDGAVYCVAGSSGTLTPAPLDHPAMCVSLAELGSVLLEIDDDTLRVRFVDSTGAIDDEFEIDHLPPLPAVRFGKAPGISAPDRAPSVP